MTERRLRGFVGLALLTSCGQGGTDVHVVPNTAKPPAAVAMRAVIDTLHGVSVPDGYRWLEDTTDATVRAWMQSQGEFADRVLAQGVGTDSIARRIERMYASLTTLGDVSETPARVVLARWFGAAPSLMALDASGDRERLLLADTTLAAAQNGARMRAFVPSWNGRNVAIGTTAIGDSAPGISVVDAERGVLLRDRIPDLLATTSGTRYEVTWLRDGTGFIYPREWPGAARGPQAERLARGRQFIHRLGTPQSDDVAIFGFGVSPDVPAAPADLPTRVHTAPDSDWLVGAISRLARNGGELYASRLISQSGGRLGTTRWQRIGEVEDRLGAVQLRGDTVYAISGRADRGQLVRRVLRDDATSSISWDVVVPERSGVLISFSVQADAIYFAERDGGAVSLHRLRAGDSVATPITLPFAGGLGLVRRSPAMRGALVHLSTWSTTPRFFRVVDDTTVPMGIDDGGATTSPTLVSERIEARSADGTMIPISLVYDRAALASGTLDGTASLLIESYGGFGKSTDPEYSPHVQTWVALGGVYAFAHVRGGGERGDAWHRAAMREGKQRTLDDMIASIETLIARKYTSVGRVVLSGFSFGAHIPGLVVAQRPDLLGAIVFGAGQPDEIRGAHFDPTAARNLIEVGDMDSPEGIRMLLKASPYHQVPPKIALPAVLVHSARADYNFGTEMLIGKYVARLQAANTGSRPTLWVRADGGHMPLLNGAPESAAKVFAFLLWQTGDRRYQPPSK